MDEPIETQGEDELGIKDEVQEFSKYLQGRNSSTNLIASVQAPWGEGKSSFLNLVKAELESTQNKTIQVVRFNPWQFSGHQDLLQQFFTTFAESKGISSEFKSALSSIGSLANLTALVPGLELVSLIGKVLNKGAAFANSIPNGNIQKLRNEAIKEARKSEHHHIFLIDELDRLESHEVRSFLQMLKAVADFPNTTYVLAYDAEALEDLLNDSGVGKPRVYLEKIIGFSFCLPTIRMDDLQRHHLTEINSILEHQGLELIDYDRWSTNEVYAALPNLRQCKRHVAHFEYLCCSIGKYVDTTDLAYVSIIQLLDPSLWRTIGENQTWFWGTPNGGSEPNQRLLKLRATYLAQGKESVWRIVCIVYEGVVERSKQEDDDFFLSNGTIINQPIRAASNNAFVTYHTRKPVSKWSHKEIGLIKQAFKKTVDINELYSLLIRFPDEFLIWVRHLSSNIREYDKLSNVFFITQFINVLEMAAIDDKSRELLFDNSIYQTIDNFYSDMDLAKAIFNDEFEASFKLNPIYYALTVSSLPRLRHLDDVDGILESVDDKITITHQEFWKNTQDLITCPFIHWAFDAYLRSTTGKKELVSSELVKIVDGEEFWLKKENLPHVLLLASVAKSRSGNSSNIKEFWVLVLGKIPDFSMLFRKIQSLDIQPSYIQTSIDFWKNELSDILVDMEKGD